MSEKSASLKGADRAAVFLLGIGEKSAAQVLKHLGPKEVHKVGEAMAGLKKVSAQQAEEVISSFSQAISEVTSLSGGKEDYIRNVLVAALGEDKAQSVINRVVLGKNSKGVETLRWMDARSVANVIKKEHAQVIAIVLSYLDSDHAAGVLKHLPESVSKDVVMRIARLDTVHPSALIELDAMLEKQFSEGNATQPSAVGGLKATADILQHLGSDLEETLLETITAQDSDMGEKIKDLMFVFENLLEVEDRGVQRLLREVSSEILVVALKGADDRVSDKILSNMSKRAGEMLAEDIETSGPVRLSEVEAAQKEILVVAERLAEEGELVLGSRGGEEFV
ncbi:MAG: flagellar motor switch protein FliG [Porticoccaceae bacterium]|nr:flagellar motor switch protein FliG [Porticoccaceae bacterium]